MHAQLFVIIIIMNENNWFYLRTTYVNMLASTYISLYKCKSIGIGDSLKIRLIPCMRANQFGYTPAMFICCK